MRTLLLLVAAAALASAGCSSDREERRSEAAASAILFTKGASTDPYGTSRPNGFGVLLAPTTQRERVVEVTDPELGWSNGAAWLGDDRIVVARKGPPLAPPILYRLAAGKLLRLGPAPVLRLEISPVWSPDEKLIAAEPVEPCEKQQRTVWECYGSSARVVLRAADGSHRRQVATGHVGGWTPDGRLLVTNLNFSSPYDALQVESGRRSRPLSPSVVGAFAGVKTVGLGPPRWSADRRFIAAMIGGSRKAEKTVGAIVVTRADGRPVRLLRSPYMISMFAWSPVGHRLAYTTSGFPDPHELFVLDEPGGKRVRLYATAGHFDWITWSPDGRQLLLDEGVPKRWKLFGLNSGKAPRVLRRLGGRPLWCCPVNSYTTING